MKIANPRSMCPNLPNPSRWPWRTDGPWCPKTRNSDGNPNDRPDSCWGNSWALGRPWRWANAEYEWCAPISLGTGSLRCSARKNTTINTNISHLAYLIDLPDLDSRWLQQCQTDCDRPTFRRAGHRAPTSPQRNLALTNIIRKLA